MQGIVQMLLLCKYANTYPLRYFLLAVNAPEQWSDNYGTSPSHNFQLVKELACVSLHLKEPACFSHLLRQVAPLTRRNVR